ncbi:MAG TPA: hypothetical protein VF681_03600 [Abditibacteriaceae bacterium]|jgi:hypothetical protein
MVLEAILFGAGAYAANQIGTKFSESLVPELVGAAIGHGLDAILNRVRPETNQFFMTAAAAALKQSTKELLKSPEMWQGSVQQVWRSIGADSEKLLGRDFDEPQRAVRDALFAGSAESLNDALNTLVDPYFDNSNIRTAFKLKLSPAFLRAFNQIIRDEKYEESWKDYQRELSLAIYQGISTLNTNHEELLVTLREMSEGRIELPSLLQVFDEQAVKLTATLTQSIREDGQETRAMISNTQEYLSFKLDSIDKRLDKIGGTEQNQEVPISERTWQTFFAEAGQANRFVEFLERWPSLNPDARFAKPKEWEEIGHSLSVNPLTFVIGPPAVGKTFSAVQLLFGHYMEGKPVRWINILEAGLPDAGLAIRGVTPGFRERIRLLNRQLGLNPPKQPIDPAEFVTANIQPDSLVLLEDPFGQTEDEFSISLHTYDFFDLHSFITSLLGTGQRSSARLLVTSRQNLFERWKDECLVRGVDLPPCGIIHLTNDSYATFLSVDDSPQTILTAKLIRCRDLQVAPEETNQNVLENIARLIGTQCETPREVELVIDSLHSPVTIDQAQQFEGFRNGILQRTADHCHTNDDGERLFLFLLMALNFTRFNHEFSPVFKWLHRLLDLPNCVVSEEARIRAAFRPIYNKLPYFRSILHKPKPLSEVKAHISNDDINQETEAESSWDFEALIADEVIEIAATQPRRIEKILIPHRDSLEPAHSTVTDAVRVELRKYPVFLSELIRRFISLQPSLNKLELDDGGEEAGETRAVELRQHLLEQLLTLSGSLEDDAEKMLANFVLDEITRLESDDRYSAWRSRQQLIGQILEHWNQLSTVVRNGVFDALRDDRLPADMFCSSLSYRLDFAQDEAWPFYTSMLRILWRDGILPRMGLAVANPFEYFLHHLDDAPSELIAFFDFLALDQRQLAPLFHGFGKYLEKQEVSNNDENLGSKEIFAYAEHLRTGGSGALTLVGLFNYLRPSSWKKVPDKWKLAFLNPAVRASASVQRALFLGFLPGLVDGQAVPEVITLLIEGLSHTDVEVRRVAGESVLTYWYLLTDLEQDALCSFFHQETDIKVLLRILSDGKQRTTAFLRLVQIILTRANVSQSISLLNLLIKTIEDKPRDDLGDFDRMVKRDYVSEDRLWAMAKESAERGGEWARAVVWQKFKDKEGSPYRDALSYGPVASWENESEPMRLAFVYESLSRWNRWFRKQPKPPCVPTSRPPGANDATVTTLVSIIDSLSHSSQLWAFIWIGHECHWWSGSLEALAQFAFNHADAELRDGAEAGRDYELKNRGEKLCSESALIPFAPEVENLVYIPSTTST